MNPSPMLCYEDSYFLPYPKRQFEKKKKTFCDSSRGNLNLKTGKPYEVMKSIKK